MLKIASLSFAHRVSMPPMRSCDLNSDQAHGHDRYAPYSCLPCCQDTAVMVL